MSFQGSDVSETGAHRVRIWAILLDFQLASQNGWLVHIFNGSVREFWLLHIFATIICCFLVFAQLDMQDSLAVVLAITFLTLYD